MTKPFLLLTNDDGIYAFGLRHLWEVVSEEFDVAIVAPKAEKSGCGLAITWDKPLIIQEISWGKKTSAWCLNGTPADCVKMGLGTLLSKKPNLIISGINHGSNAGRTALNSGTVGGVIEGALKGIPGIAFSFVGDVEPPLEMTKPYILSLIHHLLKNPLPVGTILNVNFPESGEIKGLRFARQGRARWVEKPDRRIHPQGDPYYWLGGTWETKEEEPESDVFLLGQGYVTAVPIHIAELTDEEALQSLLAFQSDAFLTRPI